MRIIDAADMKKLEEFAIEAGIPARILMENAGKGTASSILSSIKWLKRAVVLAGKGNNGGDGLVTARYLAKCGVMIDVFLLSQEDQLSADSKINLDILKKTGQKFHVISKAADMNIFKEALLKSDVLLDAVYGTGFVGEIKDLVADVFDIVNNGKAEVKNKIPYQVVSIDCPSGADISTGKISPHTIRADMTVTFEYYKVGLLQYPASSYAGKIFVIDIGIPKPNPIEKEPLWKTERSINKEKVDGIEIIDSRFVASIIPRRKSDVHKGSCGKALIISGSPGMTGAAVLCGQAALRVGAGLVVIGVPESLLNFVDSMSIETITWGLPETKSGTISPKAVNIILQRISEYDVLAVGPGLSKSKSVSDLIVGLLASGKLNIPVILDADAINSIDIKVLKKYGKIKDISITPHPGEMSRLIGKSIDAIQKNRIKIANEIAVDYNINVLLKGAFSVIALKNNETYVNPTGSPAMASAGVGDVLTGSIAGLIAQGVDPFKALSAAAYIHGMAGSVVAGVKGEHGVIASDLLDSLPFVMESILKSN